MLLIKWTKYFVCKYDKRSIWTKFVHYSTSQISYSQTKYWYLIRLEHKKCSEMCVRIVRFGLKLKKMGPFLMNS
jgi:hypothetical protein